MEELQKLLVSTISCIVQTIEWVRSDETCYKYIKIYTDYIKKDTRFIPALAKNITDHAINPNITAIAQQMQHSQNGWVKVAPVKVQHHYMCIYRVFHFVLHVLLYGMVDKILSGRLVSWSG